MKWLRLRFGRGAVGSGDVPHDATQTQTHKMAARYTPRWCDRCGLSNPHVHLIGYDANDHEYWLCPDCINTLIVTWLLDHEEGLQAAHLAREATRDETI